MDTEIMRGLQKDIDIDAVLRAVMLQDCRLFPMYYDGLSFIVMEQSIKDEKPLYRNMMYFFIADLTMFMHDQLPMIKKAITPPEKSAERFGDILNQTKIWGALKSLTSEVKFSQYKH